MYKTFTEFVLTQLLPSHQISFDGQKNDVQLCPSEIFKSKKRVIIFIGADKKQNEGDDKMWKMTFLISFITVGNLDFQTFYWKVGPMPIDNLTNQPSPKAPNIAFFLIPCVNKVIQKYGALLHEVLVRHGKTGWSGRVNRIVGQNGPRVKTCHF